MTQPRADSPEAAAPLVLRRATAHDAAGIIAVGSKTFTSSFGWSMPPEDLAAYLAASYAPSAIARALGDPLVDIVVACPSHSPARVVGFAQLTQGGVEPAIGDAEAPVELQRLYVDEAYHGQGAGTALLGEVEGIARARGFKTMWLGVWEENLKAQRVYEKCGFSKVGIHDFVMGNCVQTDWVLTKTL